MNSAAGRLRAIPSWQVTLGVALLALGFLVAAQLQTQGPRTTYTSQERQPLVQSAVDLQGRQDLLKQQLLDLRAQIGTLEQQGKGNAALVQGLNTQLERARLAAGLTPVKGTGIVIQLGDSTSPIPPGANDTDYRVSSQDVRTVVDELWLAGAEAISVNGERITGSTAILDIGGSVLVNSAYLAPPYQVTAIGAADLYDRMSKAPSFVDFIRARAQTFGIRISFAQPPEVTLPAFAGSLNLRYARPASAGPGASGAP